MNEYQKSRFARKVVETLFNTITGKRIAILGWAFKKDTGDTRESPSISIANHFLQEKARVNIYDPQVEESQIWYDLTNEGQEDAEPIKKAVTISKSALEACKDAEAIVICTEWDEFKTLDWQVIYDNCPRPAFVFDGRIMLNRAELQKIGFKVVTIGSGDV
jgi:UDPglucose 6-dehydrogenase